MNAERPIAIRDGRKIVRYEYRNVHIVRHMEGKTFFLVQIQRRHGEMDTRWLHSLNEATEYIDRTLKNDGRDWYAKPVAYTTTNGVLTYVDWRTNTTTKEMK